MRDLNLLLLGCLACTGDKADPSPEGDDTGDPSSPTPAPCAAGDWGGLDADEASAGIQVRVEGSDAEGDGSALAPLASLDAALAAFHAGGAPLIFLGPGSFEATLELDGGTDDGLGLFGCGPDETRLQAADDASPVVRVNGATGLSLGQLTTSGGTRALWFWQGAEATLQALRVEDSTRLGIVFDGSQTVVSGEDIEILDPITDAGELGYGLLVSGAQVSIVGGGIWGATGAGVVASGVDARLSLDGLEIDGTQAWADGSFGRGVQVQDQAQVLLQNLMVSHSQDAGIFVLDSFQAVIEGSTIEDSLGAALDSGASSGDGIVIGASGGSPDWYPVSLTDNVVQGSARAGILLSGVTATLSGNALSANGYDPGAGAALAQEGAVIDGDAAWVMEDEGLSALEIRLDPLDADALEP